MIAGFRRALSMRVATMVVIVLATIAGTDVRAQDPLPRPQLPPSPLPPTPAPAVPLPDSIVVSRQPRDVRICAGGDMALGTNLDTTWVVTAQRRFGVRIPALPPPDSLLRPLRPLLDGADIVLLNIEAAIGRGPAPRKCSPQSRACFALRQPVSAAGAYRRIAPRATVVGNLANNHARDAGAVGFVRTVEHLQRAGVVVTGADTVPALIAVGEDTIAVLGFATSPELPDARDLELVRRLVRRAAEQYPRVVVTAHIGAEGIAAQRTQPVEEMFYGSSRGNPVEFARAAVESGAMLVVGHGPHVMRAVEWQRNGEALVAYSLGNLLTHGPFLMAEPLNRGAVLCATLAGDGVVRDAVLLPTWQRIVGQLSPDPTGRAVVLVDSLTRLDFPGTGGQVLPDGRLLPPAPAVSGGRGGGADGRVPPRR